MVIDVVGTVYIIKVISHQSQQLGKTFCRYFRRLLDRCVLHAIYQNTNNMFITVVGYDGPYFGGCQILFDLFQQYTEPTCLWILQSDNAKSL